MRVPLISWKCKVIPCQYDGPVFHEGSSRKRARLEKHGGDIIEVEDNTTAAPGPAQSRQEADVMDVEEDATATPGPSQPLFPELEEEEDEDEVLFREKVDDNGEDKGIIRVRGWNVGGNVARETRKIPAVKSN